MFLSHLIFMASHFQTMPKIEKLFYHHLDRYRVNKVNVRKEFFQ